MLVGAFDDLLGELLVGVLILGVLGSDVLVGRADQLLVESVASQAVLLLREFLVGKRGGGGSNSGGDSGTPTPMAVELFNRRAGIELVHVPYKGGGGAQSSILAGETQIYFANIVTAMPHVQTGRLRALAVTSPKRVPLIPDYPTIAESGYPGYESETWFGLMLPAQTPKNIVAIVRTAALAALNAPANNKRLIEMAFIPIGDSAAEFAAYIQAEIATYGKLVRELKVTSE